MFKERKLKKALKCIDEKDAKGLEKILKSGFDPFYAGKDGRSIFNEFILNREIESMVRDYSSVFNLPEKIKREFDAVLNNNIDYLKTSDIDPNTRDRTDRTLLETALEKGSLRAAKYLISIAKEIENKRSVLGAAFGNADEKTLTMILEKINLKELMDEEILDYLHYQTIYNNNLYGLTILLDYADLKKDGAELFNESIRNTNLEMVEIYISKGVDLNGKFEGKTPLIALSEKICTTEKKEQNSVGIAKRLIEAGADPFLKDNNGKIAEDYAFFSNKKLGNFLRDLRLQEESDN